MRWLRVAALCVVLVGLALGPAAISAHRIAGVANEPNYLVGDLVAVNRWAYDVRLPLVEWTVWRRPGPERGDVVLTRLDHGRETEVVRRVAGIPGDRIEVRESRLRINGKSLDYLPAPPSQRAGSQIGEIVEMEVALGAAHSITYTPGECAVASFGPIVLGDDEYFLLGDNRDRCVDSRRVGPARRQAILGAVSSPLFRRDTERD